MSDGVGQDRSVTGDVVGGASVIDLHTRLEVRTADRVLAPDDLLRERIGDVLRAERRSAGRRLVDVAREAGVSPSHLSDIERGRKEMSSEVFRAVHRSLGLGLDDVLHRATGPVALAA